MKEFFSELEGLAKVVTYFAIFCSLLMLIGLGGAIIGAVTDAPDSEDFFALGNENGIFGVLAVIGLVGFVVFLIFGLAFSDADKRRRCLLQCEGTHPRMAPRQVEALVSKIRMNWKLGAAVNLLAFGGSMAIGLFIFELREFNSINAAFEAALNSQSKITSTTYVAGLAMFSLGLLGLAFRHTVFILFQGISLLALSALAAILVFILMPFDHIVPKIIGAIVAGGFCLTKAYSALSRFQRVYGWKNIENYTPEFENEAISIAAKCIRDAPSNADQIIRLVDTRIFDATVLKVPQGNIEYVCLLRPESMVLFSIDLSDLQILPRSEIFSTDKIDAAKAPSLEIIRSNDMFLSTWILDPKSASVMHSWASGEEPVLELDSLPSEEANESSNKSRPERSTTMYDDEYVKCPRCGSLHLSTYPHICYTIADKK